MCRRCGPGYFSAPHPLAARSRLSCQRSIEMRDRVFIFYFFFNRILRGYWNVYFLGPLMCKKTIRYLSLVETADDESRAISARFVFGRTREVRA